MSTEKIYVTPEMADKWLDGPVKNRPLSDMRVSLYSDAMSRGEWQYNPADAICFNTNDVLINGQHRMWAIVESQTSQWFAVATDVEDLAQDVMDQGYRRTIAHQLHIDDVPLAKETAAVARVAIQWSEGRLIGSSTARNVTVTQVRKWVEDSDETALVAAIHGAKQVCRQYRFSMGPVGAMLYKANRIDEDDALAFWTNLVTLTDLGAKDPIFHLSKYMQRQTMLGRKHDITHQLWLLTNTWNHWRDGHEIGKIMSPTGALTMKNFQEMK